METLILNYQGGCLLICHDSNHNGDDNQELGCGNPSCWKHIPGKSTEPKPVRCPTCRHPFGTFEGEVKQ